MILITYIILIIYCLFLQPTIYSLHASTPSTALQHASTQTRQSVTAHQHFTAQLRTQQHSIAHDSKRACQHANTEERQKQPARIHSIPFSYNLEE